MEKTVLARDGGTPVRTSPLPSVMDASGRRFGDDEVKAVERVLRSGMLSATWGTEVPALELEFADLLGAGYAVACSSGTAALHLAVAAVDPEPGDEIITTPISDMGTVFPIMMQNAVPVFADVDPITGNLDPAVGRGRHHAADQGRDRRPPVRQTGAGAGVARALRSARDPADRGLRPGLPRAGR